MGDAKEQIAKTQQQILAFAPPRSKEAVDSSIRPEPILPIFANECAQRGVLERIKITAPVRGVVVKLKVPHGRRRRQAGRTSWKSSRSGRADHRGPCGRATSITSRPVRRPPSVDGNEPAHHADVTGKVMYVSADALPDETAPGSSGTPVW
jgi:hypothetical protein